MGTKNVSLPADLERFVEAKVASGEYAHFSEVVRDALRLLMARDADKLEWLRDAIGEGIVSAQTEPLVELNDAQLARIFERGEARAKTRANVMGSKRKPA